MVLQLPPTPADFERVELVLRSLTAIHASTDDIMKMVAEHAYGGFPPAVAKALAGNVSQTATLCRHCQHCLVLCNPRAVLISDGDEGRNLPLEVKAATERFEQVSLAARSVLSQMDSAAPTPRGAVSSSAAGSSRLQQQHGSGGGGGAQGVAAALAAEGHAGSRPRRAVWDELFQLQASEAAAAPAATHANAADADAADADTADAAADAAGTDAADATRHPSPAPQQQLRSNRAAGSSGVLATPLPPRQPPQPQRVRMVPSSGGTPSLATPPPLQPPASAVLSLWQARSSATASAVNSAVEDARRAGAAATAATKKGSSVVVGAFDTLSLSDGPWMRTLDSSPLKSPPTLAGKGPPPPPPPTSVDTGAGAVALPTWQAADGRTGLTGSFDAAALAASPAASPAAASVVTTSSSTTTTTTSSSSSSSSPPASLRDSLAALTAVTGRIQHLVSDHVWAGFTRGAEEELRRLQAEGRSHARSCRRHMADRKQQQQPQQPPPQQQPQQQPQPQQQAKRRQLQEEERASFAKLQAEVERAIGDYGQVAEVAFHAMRQRMPKEGEEAQQQQHEEAEAEAEAAGAEAEAVEATEDAEAATGGAAAPRAAAGMPASAPAPAAASPPPTGRRHDVSAAAHAMEAHFSQHAHFQTEQQQQQQMQMQMQMQMQKQGQGIMMMTQVRDAELKSSMALNASIIEDQQQALRLVAQEVSGLNELFHELGHLVAEQGEEVENVASLAHAAADDVSSARSELEKAEQDLNKDGCAIS